MSVRNLEHLFHPISVALIGASSRPHSVGATLLANLLHGGFCGEIMPVNPKYAEISGIPAYKTISDLPKVPDLAIICTPAATVPGVISELGEAGCLAAIVISAGLNLTIMPSGETATEAMLNAARPFLLRVLGPNCVGVLVPGIGLNASFAHANALPGKLAFVSQSGALTTAVLDWANGKGVGFSHFVSLGDCADVDMGDMLDYLASDPATSAILLYVESLRGARKFMSAARAAARNKPVLVVKAGRAAAGAKAAASHTGALAGADAVYDAAIRRAGMLRVYTTEDLFDAAETLARAKPLQGERLAIMTNGGGAGVLAADALDLGGGVLAELGDATLARLDAALPATWSHGNPVDLIGDAPSERYVAALAALDADPDCDAILFLQAPTAIVPSQEIAEALLKPLQQATKPVFASWLGGEAVAGARQLSREAGIPTYDTPEQAVRAYLQLVDYRRNQTLLRETPAAAVSAIPPDRAAATRLITTAQAEGRSLLTEPEAKALLAAYGIPTTPTRIATTPADVAGASTALGLPVAVKILSHDISHKSDVGGVALDLATAEAARVAAEAMQARIAELRPDARLEGFTVQPMIRREGVELIVGASTDPVFGPVILFGQGGTAVEVIADRAIGLPPLNTVLARELVARTRVARLLAGYRDQPAADHAAIEGVLLAVSQLLCEQPAVLELDINPLLAGERGVMALDARVVIAAADKVQANRLAIRPYPVEQEQSLQWRGQPLLLRPIRPEDEPQHRAFFAALSADDLHARFFGVVRQPGHDQLARYTQIDYEREMAFIATRLDAAGQPETLGVARAICDPDNLAAEFAIVVRSELKGCGLGKLLLQKLVDYWRQRGTLALVGETLIENHGMVELARKLGFSTVPDARDGVVRLKLTLRESV
ncbi:bifunctional acetate--CoA ligase family protein/GNAT family N-acetyltransferase [Chitinimonas sp.]|uniref:bifunctional acetate--CoA ligase family protein/GNAT family N-acetyltransferase n=1 Tax=Chitinimonas sp. TaxID=1934313 RepID=UPI002F954074